ncbi:hypothetical protein BGX26_012578 [Mortierella sp. AD094]|nr:hypothetical protein BGX26_012578 [Mortierella sp. AD094]
MAHFSSNDKRDDNDQEQDRDDEQEDYIALDSSDPESDVEIDLITKPPSSKALRKAPKVPKHFRKSNAKVYDNISVYAPPDSNLIFRCSQKRANWYLSRNLARQLSPTSIHLNFAPAGQGHVNDPYYLEERENKCVVCGQETADAGATMLHVVPEQYRKWFPIRLKSHSSHDVVVACPECNAQWDREAAVVRKKIVNLYKIPLEGVGWIRDHEAGVAKRSAGAVITEWNRRWQETSNQQQRQLITESKEGLAIPTTATEVAGSIINAEGASEEKVTQEISCIESSEQDLKGQKKAKVKKQNVIPPERLQVLEKNVYDWWSSVHRRATDSSEGSSSQQKRDLPSDFAKESLDNGQEITKKMKPEIATQMISPPLTSSSSSETEVLDNQSSVKRKEADEKVPLPPPGHTSVLNSAILEAALGAQANYKGEDYKEHGLLVIARVMATSPEYHQDAEESQETILTWREAEPLKAAGMRFLDLNRYSLISLGATLVAIAYSSHKSLFHTPTSFLNLGLLKSLEPILKDVMPLGPDSPFPQASFESVLNDLLHSTPNCNQPPQQHPDFFSVDQPSDNNLPTGSELVDSNYEHSRLLGGAAGIGNGFRPSVLQAMLAERYLEFRTPSPAVLLQLQVILSYLQNEKLCVLVFVNMAFCLAFLTGRLLLRTFFGDLRVIERQHMYDRALNFLLFKVVFVGAILEPRWEGLLIWTAWFTVLGFLRVFSMLCRDRFEYLTVSPNIPIRVHVKILSMLMMILTLNIAWFVFCISVFRSMLLLLSFECLTLFLDTIQTLVKYVIHLGDLSRQGPCESRRMVQYYTEFVTDTMILVTTLGHYLHIMYLHGISFTLIDAVLFLNMRSVFNNLRKKLASHQAYRQALSNMQALYPSATEKELADYSDDCAICRDSMTSAKILPCGHIFHLPARIPKDYSGGS